MKPTNRQSDSTQSSSSTETLLSAEKPPKDKDLMVKAGETELRRKTVEKIPISNGINLYLSYGMVSKCNTRVIFWNVHGLSNLYNLSGED